jgi:putative tryptophan/tyrosine transport system substrate-binding protein
MRRRDFITLVGGAVATASVLPSRAQQSNRVRRIGVLLATKPDDPESKARLEGFLQGLQQLGWVAGQNIQFDVRWGGIVPNDLQRIANELIALSPDLILAHSSVAVTALLRATRTIPIVFAIVADPVGAGYVDSLANPGGNATGFTNFEYIIAGEWLELLKEIAPRIRRAAVLRDSGIAAGPGQFGAIQAVAPSLGVDLRAIDLRDADEISRSVTAFGQGPNGGMILTGAASASFYRELVIALAAQYKLPTIYYNRYFVTAGGLMSYGPDYVDQFRRAATYVHRILNGEKPADLPVQVPTNYELVINLKTAKTLDLDVPPSLLARADDVLE